MFCNYNYSSMISMTGDELKIFIPKWAKEIGIIPARLILIKAGVGYTTALFLIAGTYKSSPKERLVRTLNMALADYIFKAS